MSKLSDYADKKMAMQIAQNSTYGSFAVENFMGGTSYEINPLDTLRIVAASSIFGEPQYYRDGLKPPSNLHTLSKYSIFSLMYQSDATVTDIFENAIESALSYDFKGTLDLALNLRTNFFMRLNPAVIFIKASQHPSRVGFNESNPGYMKSIGKAISLRPDDLTNQFEYYMYKNGDKKGLSSMVKRTWA